MPVPARLTTLTAFALLTTASVCALPGAASAWELQGTKAIIAITRDQQRLPLGVDRPNRDRVTPSEPS